MTFSLGIGNGRKLIVSDQSFKPMRKKPTLSVYDENTNTEIKVASFNNQETFEWFVKDILGGRE